MAHASDTQRIELVVTANATERDAVVDLADLAQGGARVLSNQHNAVDVAHADQGSAASNALAGKVSLVLDQLFRRDVKTGHCHNSELPVLDAKVGGQLNHTFLELGFSNTVESVGGDGRNNGIDATNGIGPTGG